jgi:hypothetical protein
MLMKIRIPNNGIVQINAPAATAFYAFDGTGTILTLVQKAEEQSLENLAKEVSARTEFKESSPVERQCIRAKKWGYPGRPNPEQAFLTYKLVSVAAMSLEERQKLSLHEAMTGHAALRVLVPSKKTVSGGFSDA